MKQGGSEAGAGGCLGAPMRALSRACDSACDLYVRGMSGCARHVPAGMEAGRGFGGMSPASMHLRVSSDRRDDLVRAASSRRQRQRRVEAEPACGTGDAGEDNKGGLCCHAAAQKKGLCMAPAVGQVVRRKRAAAMGTIAEDAPYEFTEEGVWVRSDLRSTPPLGRLAAAGGLAARGGGFGANKVGGEAFAR